MKKVLLIVIDALATRVVEPAMAAGRLPNFQKLAEAGVFRRQCTSIFPSITPAATCSIATGCYPREHGIAGAYWYNTDRDEVAYFGDDIWAILEKGFAAFIHDFQIELNQRRLEAPTIFEHLSKQGVTDAACLNYMWYRGNTKHDAKVPFLLKLLPGVRLDEPMMGPEILCMGDFVTTTLDSGTRLKARGGFGRRLGFSDDSTADYLMQLVESGRMPDFTLAYFPDNDFDSHEIGPVASEPALQNFDKHLGNLMNHFGGTHAMLEELAILITGDHSQCDIDSKELGIDLDALFEDFHVVGAGKSWESDEDIMACPNMRAAAIYLRESSRKLQSDIVDKLLSHAGIDQVFWSERKGESSWFHVATADRGRLKFRPGSGAGSSAADIYGGRWSWEGDLHSVDGKVDGDRITFGDYPNAFERIASCFFECSGDLMVTARVGREFCLPHIKLHDAGSHGSLHRLDSQAPLFAAGVPAEISVPEEPRTVDVMPLCLQILGATPPRLPGVSHWSGKT